MRVAGWQADGRAMRGRWRAHRQRLNEHGGTAQNMPTIRGNHMRRWLTVLVAALLGLGWTGMAAAQDYPTRPITMIVPFPAGGATDTLARFLGEQMRPILGQPIIIENIGGAAGSIGVGRAVRSPADGYTLSIGTSTTHMLTGGLYALSFDLLKDLEPIILIGSEPLLIVGKKDLPAGRSEGADRLAQGQSGQGLGGHRRRRRRRSSRRDFVPEGDRDQIPVRAVSRQRAGDAGSVGGTDRFHDRAVVEFQVAGRCRQPQAVRRSPGSARLPSSPNIPTADEAGLPGFFASLWYGLWVPKGTPKDVIAKLNATMTQMLAHPAGERAFRRTRHPDHAARPAIARSVAHVPEGRDGALVADHQGVRHQGGVRFRTPSLDGRSYPLQLLQAARSHLTPAGIGVSGKLVFQLVTPTSPT